MKKIKVFKSSLYRRSNGPTKVLKVLKLYSLYRMVKLFQHHLHLHLLLRLLPLHQRLKINLELNPSHLRAAPNTTSLHPSHKRTGQDSGYEKL